MEDHFKLGNSSFNTELTWCWLFRDVLSILSTEFDETTRDKILTTELVNNIHMIFNQPEPEQEISTPVQTKDFNALDVSQCL